MFWYGNAFTVDILSAKLNGAGSGSGTTTIYPSKYYEVSSDGKITKYISAGNDTVATIETQNGVTTSYYTHKDHLGGSSVITNQSGVTSEVLDYYPYGSIRLDEKAGTFETSRKYTGKELDEETGLYYYGARYYNASVGRFVSLDPVFLAVTFDLTDPQSLNSYAYARNNPLRYIDPTGAIYTEALTGYAVGLGQGMYSGVAGLVNTVIHPIQTVSNTVGLYGDGISAGKNLYSNLASNYGQVFTDIKNGYGMSYNEFASKSYYEQGKEVGNFFGQIEVIAAAGKVGSELNSQKVSNSISNTQIRAQRNAYLAGENHPVTGIPFDKSGYPNFSSVSKMDVQINFSGSRPRDVMSANKIAGYDRTPAGYVWHHHQDGMTLQLVPRDIHIKTGHDGGFAGR